MVYVWYHPVVFGAGLRRAEGRTVEKLPALHMPNPSLISDTMYDPRNPSGVIPEPHQMCLQSKQKLTIKVLESITKKDSKKLLYFKEGIKPYFPTYMKAMPFINSSKHVTLSQD